MFAGRLIVLVTCVFLAVPVIVAIMMAFDARSYLATFPPPDVSLQWFRAFFSNEYYLRGLQTSVIVSASVTAAGVVLGVTTAIFLELFKPKIRETLTAGLMSPLFVPGVVMGFALFVFFVSIQLNNPYLRLIVGHTVITFPFVLRSVLAGLSGIPPSLREAALTLGATETRAYLDVILPLGKTGIFAGGLFAFAFSFDDVAVALFLSDSEVYTLPVALLTQMRSAFDLSLAAASVMMIVISTALVIVLDSVVGLDRIVGKGGYSL